MITNVNKKVVCIKDIPSNLIEEAIFILKSEKENNFDCDKENRRKEIIEKEAENLLSEYITEEKEKFKKVKLKHLDDDFRKTKIKAVLISVAISAVFYLMFRLF